ncbi:MAG: hypothetical protein M2R46_05606 [Verrucomicrobia subdivision 3 bacterium]|nr:hypothetical protein [Limisphaerales bacterium]
MAGSRVAMQVNAAGGFEDAAHRQEPLRHIREISRQPRVRPAQGLHPKPPKLCGVIINAGFPHEHRQLLDGVNPLTVQRPLIAKGLDLFRQRTTGLVFIDSVVGPIRVEGRVEVNQVRAARTQFILHNSQAIVVIKLIDPAHARDLRMKQAKAVPLLYLQDRLSDEKQHPTFAVVAERPKPVLSGLGLQSC